MASLKRITLLYMWNTRKEHNNYMAQNLQHKVVCTTQHGINYAAAVVHNTQRIRDWPDGEPSSSSVPLSLSWLLFDLIESKPPSRQDRWYAWQQ
jgi:hypothetical protein